MEVGQERNRIRGRYASLVDVVFNHLQLNLQRLQATDLGHGHPGQHDDHGHLQDELKKIGNQNPP